MMLSEMYGWDHEAILRHADITQDRSRTEAMILAPDSDTENKRNSRKWDVGANFYSPKSWDNFRRSLFMPNEVDKKYIQLAQKTL